MFIEILAIIGAGTVLVQSISKQKKEEENNWIKPYKPNKLNETQYERAQRRNQELIEKKRIEEIKNEIVEVEIIESNNSTDQIFENDLGIKRKNDNFRPYTTEERKAYGQKQKENKVKGNAYEEQVADYYRSKGYDVIEHGKLKGRKDGGIDLIASNSNKTLLIQCKNWTTRKITHAHLKEFLYNAKTFIENNNLTGNINYMYIVSNQILDKSAKGFLYNANENIDFKVIPYLEG